MHRQSRNVFATIPQRRQMDFNRIQAEQQISAESPRSHFFIQICIGRGKDTDIHTMRLRGAHALELAGFQHTEQLRLLVERNIGDFIEKQRASVR